MVSMDGLVPITRAFLASYYDKYPFTPLSDDVSRLTTEIRSVASDLCKDFPPIEEVHIHQSASVASQWLELLHQDTKGHLAAFRRKVGDGESLHEPEENDVDGVEAEVVTRLGKMDATKKQLTKPSTATKKVTNYEKQRMKNINKNRERMNALGVKNITTCLKATVQHKKLRKEKQIPIEGNDDDYRPSEANDGSDIETYDSFEHELLEIPSRARSQSHHEALTHALEEGDTSSRPEVTSNPPPPLNVEPQLEVTAGNTIAAKRTRGPTRGKEVQGLVDKDGKLSVPIPPEFRAPVGDYASKLASKIGVEVRTRLPNPSVRRWKYVDASVKEAMFQRLNDQFDLQGDPVDIEKAMNTKFGRKLSNHTYRLHKQFMELKEEQSKANIANRERMYTKHRCGSRSIPVRVEKLAREKKMLPNLAELYKETHYNEKTHEWISSQAQCNYENMIQTQADHLSQPGSTPLTAEELSIKVLKPRSGYVKGLGMRPSSSIMRATTIYAETNDYVKRLEMQIETQKEQIQIQNNKIEDLEEGKKKQGEIMADVVNFLRTKGFTGYFGSGGTHPQVDILLGSLLGATLMVIFKALTPNQAFATIDLPILGLLFGTMVVSVYLEQADMFKYLGKLLSWKSQGPKDLLCRVCLVSAISSSMFTNDMTCVILTEFMLKIPKQNNVKSHPFCWPWRRVLISVLLQLRLGTLKTCSLSFEVLCVKKGEEEVVIFEEEVTSHRFSPVIMSHSFSMTNVFNSNGSMMMVENLEEANPVTVQQAMEVKEEEEEDEGLGKEKGDWKRMLRKLSVYVFTNGMLIAFLLGLNMSWTALTATLVLVVLDFKDARPSLEKGRGMDVLSLAAVVQEIGKAGSKFIQEELKMKSVYDYMFHLLYQYGTLLKYKPTVPEGSIEVCLETMACSRTELICYVQLDAGGICCDVATSLALVGIDMVSYPLLIFFCGMFITVDGFNRTGIPTTLWNLTEPHARINHRHRTSFPCHSFPF
ncbi:unnamed protein product [Camellia sinensis]